MLADIFSLHMLLNVLYWYQGLVAANFYGPDPFSRAPLKHNCARYTRNSAMASYTFAIFRLQIREYA